MARGIYVAASGSVARLDQLEVLANDLAQVNTPGFKRDQVTFESVRRKDPAAGVDAARDKDFVQAAETRVALEQGPLIRTDNALDVALVGRGMLRVQGAEGERLTRNGRLLVARDGALKTTSGHAVLDNLGRAIFLPPDTVPDIASDGLIRADGVAVARLGVADVAEGQEVHKDREGLVKPPEGGLKPGVPSAFELLQGFLEQSNVSPIQMMTELVTVQRNFEALHQVISTYRDLDQQVTQLTR